MPEEGPAPQPREKQTGRLEAFSENLFAIAITPRRTPAAPVACTFYARVFVLIDIAFMVLLWAAFRPSLIDPEASPEASNDCERTTG
jgi:hypothetical protein